MKVILNSDVYNLGEEGDIVTVKDGYARNFLLPKGLAVRCSLGNLKVFEAKKEVIEKRKAEKRDEAKSLKEKIEALSVVIKMSSAEGGKLFGSVSSANLADEMSKAGIVIERKRIEIAGSSHIKVAGNYTAKIKLYENESAVLPFTVEAVIEEK